MRIPKLRMQIDVQPNDYFWVEAEGDTFTLTLTEGRGNPIHFAGINRKQLYLLLSRAQRAVLHVQEEQVDKMMQPAVAAV